MSLNKAQIIGHLGKDPELKQLDSGRSVVKFSVATSEKWKNKDGEKHEETTWHNIVAWAKTAEVMAEYLKKGSHVYLEGKIANRSYEDKEGNTKYISEIVASSFQFLDKRGDNDQKEKQSDASPTGGGGSGLPF